MAMTKNYEHLPLPILRKPETETWIGNTFQCYPAHWIVIMVLFCGAAVPAWPASDSELERTFDYQGFSCASYAWLSYATTASENSFARMQSAPLCRSTRLAISLVGDGYAHSLGGSLAARGGLAAVRAGQAGEAAVRAAVDIGPKSAIDILGRTRIPDGLTTSVLSEVKNVGSLSYTQQLRDFAAYSQGAGLRFDLYVRPGAQLSGPLLDARGQGLINILEIPFP